MKITIWDLDYYYAADRTNKFNPDAEKISSYHKQKGDSINFVNNEDDINRPYDICYIIKEQIGTPNPPYKFLLDKKVRWWGDAVKVRINWKPDKVIWACRPDYLLYPNKETSLERGEQIRFLDVNGNLMPLTQDFTNVYKNKKIIITDKILWDAPTDVIVKCLEKIENVNSLYFLHPINLRRLINDEAVRDAFLKLHISPGANIKWKKVYLFEVDKAIELIIKIKDKNKIDASTITIDYSEHPEEHWKDVESARKDFNLLTSTIIKCFKQKIHLIINSPNFVQETPYSSFFKVISLWTQSAQWKRSWLEYITAKFAGQDKTSQAIYWSNIKKWNDNYRDLIRQTWTNKEFLLMRYGGKMISDINIPWTAWKEEFQNGI